MPYKSASYAAIKAKEPLGPYTVERRDPNETDVVIDVKYCGVCHSDVHQVRSEWGEGIFPMVPGHEIVGTVKQVGSGVTKFAVGDTVGVGCMVDSCRKCHFCQEHEEQFCANGCSMTYNGTEQDKKTPTYGGYTTGMTVDQDFVLRVPDNLPLNRTAPLLCAGITTYSPLRRFGVKPGHKVAVVGLGGLGHMGVKLAKAMGAEVSVLSTSPKKMDAAKGLGADDFIVTREPDAFKNNANRFDFILDTVSAKHDYNQYLSMLRVGGCMCLVGVPEPSELAAPSLIFGRRTLTGSLIGGIKETQEMLDFCGEHNVVSDVEMIDAKQVNEAYERMVKGDVRFRFVIDCASLEGSQ